MPVDQSLCRGACDCHVHVVGPTDRFPQSATRSYTAHVAPLDSLRALARTARRIAFRDCAAEFLRDRQCLPAGGSRCAGRKWPRRGGGRFRIGATPDLLDAYAGRRGMRDLRVNLYSKSLHASRSGSERPADGDDRKHRRPPVGWHVEIIAPHRHCFSTRRAYRGFASTADRDRPLRIPGEFVAGSPEGRACSSLVALPHVWVKLSAPYSIVADPLATDASGELACSSAAHGAGPMRLGQRLAAYARSSAIKEARTKLRPYRKIDYRRLFRDFIAALPDPALARRILVDNPDAALWFPAPAERSSQGKRWTAISELERRTFSKVAWRLGPILTISYFLELSRSQQCRLRGADHEPGHRAHGHAIRHRRGHFVPWLLLFSKFPAISRFIGWARACGSRGS